MRYPVSAQYSQLVGKAGFTPCRPVLRHKPVVKEVTPRRKFETPTRNKILNAIRNGNGPNASQIHALCGSDIPANDIRSEITRMCRAGTIRAEGEGRKHRYFENK